MRSLKALFLASVLAWFLSAACGGGGGGTPSPSPSPTPSPTPTPTPTPTPSNDPCASATLDAQAIDSTETPPERGEKVHGHERGETAVLSQVWNHRAWVQRRQMLGEAISAPQANVDIGEVSILQDEGELVVLPNAFDLKGAGVRFSRTVDGGYQLSKIDGTFRSQLGTRITLNDDDTRQVSMSFSAPFYSKSYNSAFINSDGNVTFEAGDSSSEDRSVGRLLTGPPRIAVFFADLDPSASGGRIFSQAASDQFTVTWCGVHGFEAAETTTAQMTVLPDGAIEMKFGSSINLTDAIVGISPGQTQSFNPVDVSGGSASAAPGQAMGERFAAQRDLDQIAVAAKFYRDHPDSYDQLVFWTDQRLTRSGAFAFEITVANEVRGIGQSIFDDSREFGSAGRLRSTVQMDFLNKYPDDPLNRITGVGENNVVSLMGQECGHRWLALIRFRDQNGQRSDALLGRDKVHWSFFFDSDASVMEGNDIEDLGGGSFRTVATVQRYNLLDQYVMGAIPESAVTPFFYVANPTNVDPAISGNESAAPRTGVKFTGTRRDVTIQDVIAVNGPRIPSSADAPKVFRQAFIYIVSRGRTLDPADAAKIERFRTAWTQFFGDATSGRMRAETRLRAGT